MRLRPIREADVLRACLSLFKIHGWLHWRNNTGQLDIMGRTVRFGKVGSSDILAVVPKSGRLLACECKSPARMPLGRPTAAQGAFLLSVWRSGGIPVVIADVGRLEALLRVLEEDPWAEVDRPDY